MRTAIRELPDGEWRFGLDADGYRAPLRIEVCVRKSGDSVQVDYAGSSPQFTDASINCTTNITFADTYYPLKCSLAPNIRIPTLKAVLPEFGKVRRMVSI